MRSARSQNSRREIESTLQPSGSRAWDLLDVAALALRKFLWTFCQPCVVMHRPLSLHRREGYYNALLYAASSNLFAFLSRRMRCCLGPVSFWISSLPRIIFLFLLFSALKGKVTASYTSASADCSHCVARCVGHGRYATKFEARTPRNFTEERESKKKKRWALVSCRASRKSKCQEYGITSCR